MDPVLSPYVMYFTMGVLVGALVPMMAYWQSNKADDDRPAAPPAFDDVVIIFMLSVLFWPFTLAIVAWAINKDKK